MFLATIIQAQAPQGPPKPGLGKKLDYNVGRWKVEGEAKPFGRCRRVSHVYGKVRMVLGRVLRHVPLGRRRAMGPEKGVSLWDMTRMTRLHLPEFTARAKLSIRKARERRHLELDRRIQDGRRQDQCARHPSSKYPKPSTRFKLEMSQNGESFRSSKKRTAHKV